MLEPTTTITDYVLTLESLWLGALLLRSGQTSTRFWALAFFAVAIAAVCGGTVHGFQNRINGPANAALWKITVYSIGVTSFSMFAAASIVATSPPLRYGLIAAAVLQLLIYGVWMSHHSDFRYVIYNYVPAMIVVLLLQILGNPHPGSRWIIAGILLSFAGAGIQQSGVILHKNFNYNDIYHIVQMAAMYLLYRGGLLFSR